MVGNDFQIQVVGTRDVHEIRKGSYGCQVTAGHMTGTANSLVQLQAERVLLTSTVMACQKSIMRRLPKMVVPPISVGFPH